MKLPAFLSVVAAVALLAAGYASARPSGYWTATACTQKLEGLGVPHPPDDAAPGVLITTNGGYNFHVAQAVCVGSGGQQTCAWTAGERSYSVFTVYSRSKFGGVVRRFTLNTRHGDGRSVAPGKSGTPPLFYVSNIKLLATNASLAQFVAMVRPITPRLTQQENGRGCAPG